MTRKKKTVNSAYNDFAGILEDINDKFDAFGEAQKMTNEKMDRGFKEIKTEIAGLDQRLIRIEGMVFGIQGSISSLQQDVKDVKKEIREIRKEMKHVIHEDEYQKLQQRVSTLERQVSVSA